MDLHDLVHVVTATEATELHPVLASALQDDPVELVVQLLAFALRNALGPLLALALCLAKRVHLRRQADPLDAVVRSQLVREVAELASAAKCQLSTFLTQQRQVLLQSVALRIADHIEERSGASQVGLRQGDLRVLIVEDLQDATVGVPAQPSHAALLGLQVARVVRRVDALEKIAVEDEAYPIVRLHHQQARLLQHLPAALEKGSQDLRLAGLLNVNEGQESALLHDLRMDVQHVGFGRRRLELQAVRVDASGPEVLLILNHFFMLDIARKLLHFRLEFAAALLVPATRLHSDELEIAEVHGFFRAQPTLPG